MRIAEKTLELSLCAQLTACLLSNRAQLDTSKLPQPIWFGLTQTQEATAGFDAATRMGNGRLVLLQFKAGRRLKKGGIRFSANHDQMEALRKRLAGKPRFVYYVLPEVTRTSDLNDPPWLLNRSWLLDVGDIPKLAPPARVSNNHYLTLDSVNANVVITSDPVKVRAQRASLLLQAVERSTDAPQFKNREEFLSYARLLRRNSICAFLPERA